MDATAFLKGFGSCLATSSDHLPSTLDSAEWTRFMTRGLLEFAKVQGLHVCATSLGGVSGWQPNAQQHLAREFLFDFTMYEQTSWQAWSQPNLIVEHENVWTEQAFFEDFWKLMLGYAPLRVMFGYAGNLNEVERRARAIPAHAEASAWRYPENVEDLVLLRCPERGGMKWPTWRVVHRASGSSIWNDLGARPLDRALEEV